MKNVPAVSQTSLAGFVLLVFSLFFFLQCTEIVGKVLSILPCEIPYEGEEYRTGPNGKEGC